MIFPVINLHYCSSGISHFPVWHPRVTSPASPAKDCVSMFKGLPPRQIELLSSAIAEQTVPDWGKWWVYTTCWGVMFCIIHNTTLSVYIDNIYTYIYIICMRFSISTKVMMIPNWLFHEFDSLSPPDQIGAKSKEKTELPQCGINLLWCFWLAVSHRKAVSQVMYMLDIFGSSCIILIPSCRCYWSPLTLDQNL